MTSSKLVYSTASGREKKEPQAKAYERSSGPTKMRLETSGRGGKAVTVLFNIPFSETEARALMKGLQGMLGCGATFKDGRLEFQGDRRDQIAAHFAQKGLKIVRAGG